MKLTYVAKSVFNDHIQYYNHLLFDTSALLHLQSCVWWAGRSPTPPHAAPPPSARRCPCPSQSASSLWDRKWWVRKTFSTLKVNHRPNHDGFKHLTTSYGCEKHKLTSSLLTAVETETRDTWSHETITVNIHGMLLLPLGFCLVSNTDMILIQTGSSANSVCAVNNNKPNLSHVWVCRADLNSFVWIQYSLKHRRDFMN